MRSILRKIVQMLILGLIREYKNDGVQYAKIKAARTYVTLIKALRTQVTNVVTLMACMTFVGVGFLLMVHGLSLALPLSAQGRALFFIVVGVVTFATPIFLFRFINSEKNWAEKAGVDEVLSKTLPKHELPKIATKRQSTLSAT